MGGGTGRSRTDDDGFADRSLNHLGTVPYGGDEHESNGF